MQQALRASAPVAHIAEVADLTAADLMEVVPTEVDRMAADIRDAKSENYGNGHEIHQYNGG